MTRTKKYRLADLLARCDFTAPRSADEQAWLDMPDIGREIVMDKIEMKRPPHPGRSVKRDCLDPLGLSVAEGAERLGVDRHVLEDLIEGRARIDLDMAIKFEKAFGGTAETWACIRIAYDRAQSR